MKLGRFLKEVKRELKYKHNLALTYKCETDKPGIERVSWRYELSRITFSVFYVERSTFDPSQKEINEWIYLLRRMDANSLDLSRKELKFLKDLRRGALMGMNPLPDYVEELGLAGLADVQQGVGSWMAELNDKGEDYLAALDKIR